MNRAALLAIALLAACTPAASPDTPPPRGAENYRAIGTEPGWAVTITATKIEYVGNYGETRITTPRPDPRPTSNGRRYEAKSAAHTLIVDITHVQCSDGMSDRIFPDTVMVIADGKTVKGCGGAALPPAGLADTNWTIVSIGGDAAGTERPATMSFTADRLSGSSGCNQFSGSYTQSGDRLKVGSVASTRMACPGAAMEQETRLFAILKSELTMIYRDGDTLVLKDASGSEVVLRRII